LQHFLAQAAQAQYANASQLMNVSTQHSTTVTA
jgi:hypothetical protein